MRSKLGWVFAETIIKEKKRHLMMADSLENPHDPKTRIFLFFFILIFGLGILLLRLFSLTILQGDKYLKLATENRIQENDITAARGIIYDRNDVALVRNIPFFTNNQGDIYFENKPSSASSQITESVTREYIDGSIFAHLLGYTGEISSLEIENFNKTLKEKKIDDFNYQSGDIIGKMGIEKAYDSILRGKPGKLLLEVDALGDLVRTLGKINPIIGKNLKLTIDNKLQIIASQLMDGKIGAVVATIPKSGEVLVLYSSPSFDPNTFIKSQEIEKILDDPYHPLFNRAISGLYPPGSTFKIITAMAGLESGVINKSTKIEDVGVLRVGAFSFNNWYFSQYGKKEGNVDILTALKRSNDIFFYKAGEAIGIETIASFARKFGLEKDLGIDIEGGQSGLMPDPEWEKRVRGVGWFLGNTYHVAIGQGDIQTTPLHVNNWTNIIANNGKSCIPHLVFGQNLLCEDLGLKQENIEIVKEGMKLACTQGGTGWPLFNFKVINDKLKIDGIDFLETFESTTSGQKKIEIKTACKTGTAEFGDPKGRTHAWFTVFAPVVNPQISITVLIEGGGEGSTNAAPVAKKMLEEWFGR